MMRRGQRKNKIRVHFIIKLPKKWITRCGICRDSRTDTQTSQIVRQADSLLASFTHALIHALIHTFIYSYATRQLLLLLQSSSLESRRRPLLLVASLRLSRLGTSINNCKRICQACQACQRNRPNGGRGRAEQGSFRTRCDKFAMSSAWGLVACKVRQLECKCCAIMLYDEYKYLIDTLLYLHAHVHICECSCVCS